MRQVPGAAANALAQERARGHDLAIKTLLIGDSGVGKSCLLLRFANGNFSSALAQTIGVDFKIRKIQVKDQVIRLECWDTAGQERFRTITQAYYRGAQGVLIVYDVSNAQSFENIRMWLRSLGHYAADDVNRVLVGNKCDVPEGKRAVSYHQGQALAQEFGLQFFETSAKEDVHVDAAFVALAEEVVNRLQQKNAHNVSIVAVQDNLAKKVVQISTDGQGGAPKSSSCC